MTDDLFARAGDGQQPPLSLAPGVLLLPGFALGDMQALLRVLADVLAAAPLRHMVTPGGQRMSVSMSNCGPLGWVTDRQGYRYLAQDPLSGQPWPAMPDAFLQLAQDAADLAGFAGFLPDACLINGYVPGASMSLHQDKDERDFTRPIVSVSLGLPAVFLLGSLQRGDKPQPVPLQHGDVLVWGGPARLRYHGVRPVKEGRHPLLGGLRINLTFRRAN